MSDDLPRYRMKGDEHPVRRVINDQICVFLVFWVPFGILGLILTALGVIRVEPKPEPAWDGPTWGYLDDPEQREMLKRDLPLVYPPEAAGITGRGTEQ